MYLSKDCVKQPITNRHKLLAWALVVIILIVNMICQPIHIDNKMVLSTLINSNDCQL